MFLSPTRKIHGKLQVASAVGGRAKVDPRSTQGRSAAGGVHAYNLRAWSCSCSRHMFGPKYPAYGSLGPSLGLSWPHVTPMLAYVAPILALSWPHVGPSWPYLGPMLAHLGPMLALGWPMLPLSWPYLGPMLAHLGPILAHLRARPRLKSLQDDFFPFFSPPWSPKPRKNHGF